MFHARKSASVRARRQAALLEAIEPRRLMTAATLDPTFGTNGSTPVRAGDDVTVAYSASTVDSAGRVLNATLVDGQTDGFYISRFTTAGAPDGTFNGDGTVFVDAPVQSISDIVVDSTGAVFVGVLQEGVAGQTVQAIVRVGSDGFYIGNFGGEGTAVVGATSLSTDSDLDLVVDGGSIYGIYSEYDAAGDGTVVAAVAKFNATTGFTDSSFGNGGYTRFTLPGVIGHITDAVLSNGQLAITGTTLIDGVGPNNALLGRIAADGSSATFATAVVTDSFASANAVALPGGKVVIEGTYSEADNALGTSVVLIKFNADGSQDTSFAADQAGLDALNFFTINSTASALVADADGRLYLAGVTLDAAGTAYDSAVVRLTVDGDIDTSFDNDGIYVRVDSAEIDYATSASIDSHGGLFVTALGDGAAKIFKFPGTAVVPPVQTKPFTLVNGVLSYVAGATDTTNDVISITKNASGSLKFTLNGVAYEVLGTVTGIKIDGGAGNDLIKISNAITVPATLVGGAGNDSLRGGSGNDVLLGGDGDDALIGRDGQDFLVGGNGKDYLVGREDADILISGTTTLNQAGIDAVQKEWTSNHNILIKLANVTGLLPLAGRLNGNSYLTPGVTIFNDTAVDTLSGGDGADFYYAQLFGNTADVIKDNLTSFRADIAQLVLAND